MNAVGIDVSKGKSTIAVMRPFGEIVASPYDVSHTESELKELARFLKSLPGETRVLMEYTGRYYEPIARYLHNAGIFVSVVNAILAHDYSGNSIRKVKTDKIDAIKLANMAIDRWIQLQEYVPEDEIRQILKICNRQYNQYNKLKSMLKNNLIALLDQTFPDVKSNSRINTSVGVSVTDTITMLTKPKIFIPKPVVMLACCQSASPPRFSLHRQLFSCKPLKKLSQP